MDWKRIEPKFNPLEFNLGRKLEVAWIINHLAGRGKVLDIGCLDSKLAELLLPYYDEVWGIDIRSKDDKGRNDPKPFHFILGSILTNTFADQYFDEIISMSTIEHIGLDYYTNKVLDSDGDKKALDACYRILKDSGSILVTLPYSETEPGRFIDGKLWERNYNCESVCKLAGDKFKIVDYSELPDDSLVFVMLRKA